MSGLFSFFTFICVVSFHSTVTDLVETTNTPFLTFKYSCKIDKKGKITEGEYFDFDIGFVKRY